jgi:hypothetical protein
MAERVFCCIHPTLVGHYPHIGTDTDLASSLPDRAYKSSVWRTRDILLTKPGAQPSVVPWVNWRTMAAPMSRGAPFRLKRHPLRDDPYNIDDLVVRVPPNAVLVPNGHAQGFIFAFNDCPLPCLDLGIVTHVGCSIIERFGRSQPYSTKVVPCANVSVGFLLVSGFWKSPFRMCLILWRFCWEHRAHSSQVAESLAGQVKHSA